jgi:hypothetical protein
MVIKGTCRSKAAKDRLLLFSATCNRLSGPWESRYGTVLRAATSAFPRSAEKAGLAVLTADRGRSQERASVVTLVGLPKGGIAVRFAEDDNVEVSVPPIFSKSANSWRTRAAAELRSAWTGEGAVSTRPSPAHRLMACFSAKLIEGASKEAQNGALRRR